MLYRVTSGDSPTIIARTYGIPLDALIRANPHKPTTVVSDPSGRPVLTWQSLRFGEEINVPIAVGIGSPATDAINALSAVDPCSPSSVALVCAAQRALGFVPGAGVDGKWGADASAKARQIISNAPAGCSPRPAWWAPKGQSNCPTGTAAPSVPSASSNVASIAATALAALKADPSYCTSVKRSGTAVNTAIHNFKVAWNAANPTNPVPVNTGNYEPIVQIALALALDTPQDNIPAGCGAAPSAPAPTPAPTPAPAPSAAAPAAVLALVGINPCLQANAGIVCAAQSALGLTVDGKYGSGSANAAKRLVPNAPAACGTQAWWGSKGQSKCPGAAQAPQPSPVPAPTPATPKPPVPAPAPAPVAMVPGEVRALVGINPCLQQNVEIVRAAQRVLGLTPDGKYGSGSANAARRLEPRAPAMCSPAPLWWGSKGTVVPPGPPAPPPPPPAPAPAPSPGTTTVIVPPAPAPTPGPAQPTVIIPVPEEKKKISTGALIAGGIGALALVGVVAVAASSGKGTRGARGPRGSHGSKGKRGSRGRKGASRKKATKKRRR